MQYHYQIHSESNAYKGFFRIRRYEVSYESFRGGMCETVVRECMGGGYVVSALPYDPQRQEIVLVEQFRIGATIAGERPWQYEIVAGFVDVDDVSPEESMQRELEEEIGTRAQHLEHLFTYLGSPGGSAGRTHLYLAEIDSSQIATYSGLEEEGEDIAVHRLSYEETLCWLFAGKLNNSNTLLALQAFLLRHPQLQKQWADNHEKAAP
ncbi:MAG: NUDIX domain-containing protein [Cardiobacteriaceae bacterium]|nr:NUDIX domain-containing protein [Cardiobacteriaceae bacterium]